MSLRPNCPALDDMLGREFPVLNHGFVRVVDYMGNDGAVVQAARVSYGAGTKSTRDDRGLIRYLLRNGHTTPFEMLELKLHIKLPIFVARQWIRHRTASVNEYSARYSVLDEEFFVPEAESLGSQSDVNKQGRESLKEHQDLDPIMEIFRRNGSSSYEQYLTLLNENEDGSALNPDSPKISREIARSVLPVSFYTQWYWKIDLHNLLKFLELRMDGHAQLEIRQYANVIAKIVERWVPMTHEAFRDFRLGRTELSRPARDVVRSWLDGTPIAQPDSGLSKREWDELKAAFGR